MTEETPIDKLFKEYTSIKDFLTKQKEISLLNDYTNTMRKVLVLSCGSFFESQMTEMLKGYVSYVTNGNNELISFLEKQAIKQKYHTLFDWGEQDKPDKPRTDAKHFLGLFGIDFRQRVLNITSKDIDIENSQKAYIELGHIRNILVHSDFAKYQYDMKTPEDIYTLYQSANKFVPFIETQLKQGISQQKI